MFGPSLKSVPGCLVSIVPMLIGLPLALTPGFGPHDEVLAEDPPPLALLEAAVEPPEPPPPLLELLLLLPHPVKAINPIAASSTSPTRTRGTTWYVLTRPSPLLKCHPPRDPPRWRAY
jgi:hypothetical protein